MGLVEHISLRDRDFIFEAGREDPQWFVEEVLGQRPFNYQLDWLYAVRDHPRVAIRSCHGIGKSRWAGGMLAPWFLCCNVESELITTAPTYRQVVHVLWKEIRTAAAKSRCYLGGRFTKNSWHLGPRRIPGEPEKDNWYGIGYTASPNSEGGSAFVGLHPQSGTNLLIIDEAAGIPELIYEQMEGVTSSVGSKVVMISNPVSVEGDFRRACEDEELGYRHFQMDVFQTPNFMHYGIKLEDLVNKTWRQKVEAKLGYLPRDDEIPWPAPYLVHALWAEGRLRGWGLHHPAFQARVLAEFPPVGEDALIPAHTIREAIARSLPRKGWHRWGVDLGGTGPDPSIIGEAWASGYYRRIRKEQKSNMRKLPMLIAVTARASKDPPWAINIDNIGIGLGPYNWLADESIWDESRGREVSVCPVNFAEKASEEEIYKNRRAELYWGLRERFMAGEIDIDPGDKDLIKELHSLRYRVLENGQIQIESKEKFRTRRDGIGRSCDNLDAMCYAFAELSDEEVVVL